MERTAEQWAAMKPDAVAAGSQAQAFYCIQDAQLDIGEMYREIERLRVALTTARAEAAVQMRGMVEALEFIAEESDTGRSDGLPEACAAHEAGAMWAVARRALVSIRALPISDAQPPSASYQDRVKDWLLMCFGPGITNDRVERVHRFWEEALELGQSAGCTAREAHQLVDYVFGRPVGELHQEVGGTMVCLAALCAVHEIDMDAEAERELARVWTKVEKIRAKHAAKPKFSPLPGQAAQPPSAEGLPLTYKERQPIWASTQDLGFALAAIQQSGRPLPRWVWTFRQAVDVAQEAMGREFAAEPDETNP